MPLSNTPSHDPLKQQPGKMRDEQFLAYALTLRVTIKATRSAEGEGSFSILVGRRTDSPLHLAVQPPAMAHTAQPPLVPQPDFSLVPQPGPQPCSSNAAKREEATFF